VRFCIDRRHDVRARGFEASHPQDRMQRTNLPPDRHYRTGQGGQAIVLVIVGLTVLVAIVGLANDIGYAWRIKVRMQAAADAAAIAGSDALFMGGGVSPSSAAKSVATQNGFTNSSGTSINSNAVTVTVNNPPATGPNSGNSNAVEVIISQAQPTYFLAVAGFTSINVSARAVATVNSSSNCMYSLNPTASGALSLSSNSSITSSCGIQIDSSSSSALSGASNTTISAPSLGIVGNKSWGGSTLPSNTTTGVAAVSDPLSYVPTPSTSGSCTSLASVGPNATANIPSGYYCGLTVKSNSTVNLTSTGTYSFNGNISLSSNTTLTGTGVTLYFKSGSLSMSSNTALNLSAPTSGTYAGIVIFQDRSDSTALQLSSNSGMTLTGAVYAPDANLTLASNAFANVYSILVASTISISSNSTINMNANYSSLAGGSPIKSAVAVE
jgi:Putative Flp pilus-assembly TadE/G-like